ncbi:hypothetical protein ACFFSH_13325 [Streptomyces filamentosus]|uniref:Uncharacterized protein n=1 Tax=Streptomyces filamentosus TaxID=67294 RepID=A0A919BX47_STRFL|nr:hypothetical protein [Streptomyces filamentosus]KAA6210725.1 hypothetical protein CP979_29885 [Streptomyces filamentosus]GHG27554.1 hypothetical protein GCM10017667_75500 [Streptomyces filamentosus]
MSTHPKRYEILLVPAHVEDRGGAAVADTAVRSAVVERTGRYGESGYPRYEGHGVAADIDPATLTVEALLVDGRELDYGLVALVRDAPAP